MSYNYLLLKQQNKIYASLDLKLAAVQKVETMTNGEIHCLIFPFMPLLCQFLGCVWMLCIPSPHC